MTFSQQLSNKHSSSAEILETQTKLSHTHTEVQHRGIEDERSHHKKDIKATQSFPKQTLITDILPTHISNLGIKQTEMLHTQNRHTVIEYTDILGYISCRQTLYTQTYRTAEQTPLKFIYRTDTPDIYPRCLCIRWLCGGFGYAASLCV